jgi:hypothetical protein
MRYIIILLLFLAGSEPRRSLFVRAMVLDIAGRILNYKYPALRIDSSDNGLIIHQVNAMTRFPMLGAFEKMNITNSAIQLSNYPSKYITISYRIRNFGTLLVWYTNSVGNISRIELFDSGPIRLLRKYTNQFWVRGFGSTALMNRIILWTKINISEIFMSVFAQVQSLKN